MLGDTSSSLYSNDCNKFDEQLNKSRHSEIDEIPETTTAFQDQAKENANTK